MAADNAIALDGFLDEETVPGDLHGSTARFRLTVSPTDERTDEMTLPCTVADPALAHAVIHDLVPGDRLRVAGYLRLPRTPAEPMWLAVTELAVLETAPELSDPAAVATAVIDMQQTINGPPALPMGRFAPTAENLQAETYASAPVVELDGGDLVVLTTDPDRAAQALTAYAQAYDLPLDDRALARLRSRWVTFEQQPEGDWLLDDAEPTDDLATRVHYLLG